MEQLASMSDLDAAYLAGIIDGEGYIGLNPTGTGGYALRVAVKSTCHALPRWIHETTGIGRVRRITDRRPLIGPGRRQEIREWRAFTMSATAVLEQIMPYLIVKKEQARIGIVYQRQTPAERRESGERYHAELMRLNGRQTRSRANSSE